MDDNLNRDPATSGITINKTPGITADGTKPSITITKLDIMPVIRENVDLIKWRNYTRNAEARIPRRALLYSLYLDVILDAQVMSCTAKRTEAITTAKWQYVGKDGKPVDAVNELIDSLGFADLLTEIMNSKFWGYSMIECDLFQDDEGRWQMTANQFDRRHMRPELGMVMFRQTGDDGFSIREGIYAQTVLEAGNVKDLGLFLGVAQYAIYKRGGVADWANFVEVFGQPILDAEWDGMDENQRLQLLQALEEMGNNGRIVRPKGTTVQALPGTTISNGEAQEGFAGYLDTQIAKGILGSTETTGSSKSSGYAQSKVHADQDIMKNESDLDFVRRVLNSRFQKILKAFGLPYQGGSFIIPDKKPTVSLLDQMNAYAIMANDLGMPINHDDVYQASGMEKPGDYEAQMAAKQAEKEQQGDNPADQDPVEPANTPTATPAPKGKKPGNAKLSFKQTALLNLMDFFASPRR